MLSRRVGIALWLVVAVAGATPYQRSSRKGHASRLAAPAFDADSIDRAQQPELHRKDRGSAVVRAQILLGRAHFSCGEIDGEFGSNLEKTVLAFQRDRGLSDTGSVDEPTWASLNRDNAPALLHYTITDEDVKGPFAESIP